MVIEELDMFGVLLVKNLRETKLYLSIYDFT